MSIFAYPLRGPPMFSLFLGLYSVYMVCCIKTTGCPCLAIVVCCLKQLVKLIVSLVIFVVACHDRDLFFTRSVLFNLKYGMFNLAAWVLRHALFPSEEQEFFFPLSIVLGALCSTLWLFPACPLLQIQSAGCMSSHTSAPHAELLLFFLVTQGLLRIVRSGSSKCFTV